MENWLAVLVASIVAMVLGMAWYSQSVFGRSWMKLSGITQKQAEQSKKKGMAKPFIATFVATVVSAYFLQYLIKVTGASTLISGAQLGLLVGVGFIATTMFGMVVWENKPFKLYLIHAGQHVVVMAVMGAILAGL